MSRRSKNSHLCKNHPGVHTRSTCTTCKAYICKKCCIVVNGKSYCASGCVPKDLQPRTITISPPHQKQLSYKTVITWSAGTLALCAIVFATWTLQELKSLKNENSALQSNRFALLSQLKSVNTYKPASIPEEEFSSPIDTIDQQSKKIASSQKKITFKPLPPLPNTPYTLDNGPIDKPQISLTFDGGSMANAAFDIIDTLRSRNVHSTMFLTGHFIRKYPEVVALLLQEQHEIGNHTYSHPHLTTYEQNQIHSTLPNITPELIQMELTKTDNLFFSTTGKHLSKLWRGPYGEYNQEICTWAKQSGYYHVGWRRAKSWSQNLDSNDWIPDTETPGFKSPDEVLTKILSLAETKPYGINGGIILMHLGTIRKNREDQVHLKLGALIDSLRSLGYTFVPVSKMMEPSENI